MTAHEAILEQYAVALGRRRDGGGEKSYTCYLYGAGLDKILKKCGEETFEAVIAAKNEDPAELAGEINDVLYHVTVLLCYLDIPMDAVLAALNDRCKTRDATVDQVYAIIAGRRDSGGEGSYTAYLFEQGLDKILKKVGEACSLLLVAAKGGELTVAEHTADLLYHLLAMMVCKGLPAQALADELEARSQKTGNLKQMKTVDHNT